MTTQLNTEIIIIPGRELPLELETRRGEITITRYQGMRYRAKKPVWYSPISRLGGTDVYELNEVWGPAKHDVYKEIGEKILEHWQQQYAERYFVDCPPEECEKNIEVECDFLSNHH